MTLIGKRRRGLNGYQNKKQLPHMLCEAVSEGKFLRVHVLQFITVIVNFFPGY